MNSGRYDSDLVRRSRTLIEISTAIEDRRQHPRLYSMAFTLERIEKALATAPDCPLEKWLRGEDEIEHARRWAGQRLPEKAHS